MHLLPHHHYDGMHHQENHHHNQISSSSSSQLVTGKRERTHHKIDSEQVEEDIDVFKTEHRMKDLAIFQKSLNMHSQQLKEQKEGMEQVSITLKTKTRGRNKSVTEYPDSMFQLQYTYYEYLCKNKMAKEQASVDFIPYKDDDFCVDYQSYSKYFDDLSFIENGNNSAKKSGYSKFMKYYLDLWAETIYRTMVERISEKYGENDEVLKLLAEDFMKEYENENQELFVMAEEHLQYDRKKFRLKIMELFQEQLSSYSIFKRENDQKSQSK